jgi:hypothetical protein
MMSRWFAIPVAFVLIVASGILCGLWDNRWFVSHELAETSRRIAELPLDLGDWKGEDVKQDPDATARYIRQGTIHALKTRRYVNAGTGQTVEVLLATGRPGPISTHNPMTCVVNKGVMVQSSDPVNRSIKVPSLGHVDYTRCNVRNTATAGQIEEWTIFWTWHAATGWISTNNPRLRFASYRALTKLYVTRSNTEYALGLKADDPEGDDAEKQSDDAAKLFLKECLPLIDRALYGPDTGGPERGA